MLKEEKIKLYKMVHEYQRRQNKKVEDKGKKYKDNEFFKKLQVS